MEAFKCNLLGSASEFLSAENKRQLPLYRCTIIDWCSHDKKQRWQKHFITAPMFFVRQAQMIGTCWAIFETFIISFRFSSQLWNKASSRIPQEFPLSNKE